MTTTPGNIPSKDPANDSSMSGMFRAVFKKQMQKVDGQLPCVVLSYSREANRATVQPLISVLGTNGNTMSRAPVVNVPCLALTGGGYVLSFPIATGDKGWIEASDRDISLFLQAITETRPNTARMHSFEDARFVPDAFADYVIADEDAGAAVLQSKDGTTKVSVGPNGVKVSGTNVNITATEKVAFATPIIDLGNAQVDGTGNLMFNGVRFATHVHSGVQAGTDDSGGVVGVT